MELMIGEIFLKALVLCGILYLVARREADFQFSKLVLVTCGITLGNFALEVFLAPQLANYIPFFASAAVTLLVAVAFVTFMVVRFCWVRLWKGVIVTVLFMGFSVGLSVAGAMLVKQINQSVEKAGGSVMEQNNKEALQMFREMTAVTSSQMMQQAKAEGLGPAPAQAKVDAEAPSLLPAVMPPEESVEPPPRATVTPPPPKQPIDELPAFARTPEWQAAQAKIKVSAVLVERDGSNTAIVNGEVLGIGDVLTVEVKKKLYRFKMAELTTDWVAWEPMGETDAD
jgi:hypothetical protein